MASPSTPPPLFSTTVDHRLTRRWLLRPDFCIQDEAPTLTCSPANSSAGDLDSFSAAAAAQRSRGYSAIASLLAVQLLPPMNRSAVTIFAPTDANLGRVSGGDFAGFLGEMARHTAPCRLAWADLVGVGEVTKVPTFVPGFPAVVISKSGEFVAVNGVPFAQPNIYFGESIVVHGLGSAASLPPSTVVALPPTSTLSTLLSVSRVRKEDVSVQYTDFCKMLMCYIDIVFPGDPAVDGFEGTHLVFMAVGSDPFDVITNAVK